MTQTMYAHVNKLIINLRKDTVEVIYSIVCVMKYDIKGRVR
jgi:hypothetical protein